MRESNESNGDQPDDEQSWHFVLRKGPVLSIRRLLRK
jgi:hypothetical protein